MTKVLQTGAPQVGPKLTTVIPVRIKRSGGRKWMIPAAGQGDGGTEATRRRSLRRCRAHSIPLAAPA